MAGYYRTPPLWAACGSGAAFTDVDGHRYLDFNVCDMSAILGNVLSLAGAEVVLTELMRPALVAPTL
jgi:4-aminobutyrate aminotransferase-like enzyme